MNEIKKIPETKDAVETMERLMQLIDYEMDEMTGQYERLKWKLSGVKKVREIVRWEWICLREKLEKENKNRAEK